MLYLLIIIFYNTYKNKTWPKIFFIKANLDGFFVGKSEKLRQIEAYGSAGSKKVSKMEIKPI